MGKYELEQKKSLMKLVAQKVSQKIDSLPQIECLSQRWIWELIQNAKDADNQFDKIHIQMELYDDRFVFKHNGCPFTESNIQSLIFHYSSKDDENKEEVQTTGKYGTGFMVTYIISKKVRLNCMLKSSPEEDDQFSNEERQDEQAMSLKKNGNNVEVENISTKKSDLKQSKILAKQTQQLDYYQQISLLIDRSYTSVQQLTEKLVALDKDLRKQLKFKEKNHKYVRDQFSIDTEFVYEDLQLASFKDISEGMISIKKLFPLALLFNKKLYSLRFTNFSKKIKEPNFEIIRQTNFENPIKVSGFNIFSSVFYTHTNDNQRIQKDKVTVQYLYEVYKQIHTIVAFPVKIQGNKINLLKLQENIPKLFKQFPLIGCDDTGFNFVFTSRDFYPAQNRKDLLLNEIQNRKCPKAETNWSILLKFFTLLKSTYVLLATKTNKGKFNLFHFEQKKFTSKYKSIKSSLLQQKIRLIKTSIVSQKIFTAAFKDKDVIILLSLQQLQIIYDSRLNKEVIAIAYKLFSFLFTRTIVIQQFLELNEYIHSNKYHYKQISSLIKSSFATVTSCIQLLANLGFKNFVSLFSNKEKAIKHLGQIYRFLFQYQPHLIHSQYSIILNQNDQFIPFYKNGNILSIVQQQSNIKAKIEDQFNGKKQLFEIADKLEIKYAKGLIHKQLQQIFKYNYDKMKINEQKGRISLLQNFYKQFQIQKPQIYHHVYFRKLDIIKQICAYFNSYSFIKMTIERLNLLGKVLSSFNIMELQSKKLAIKLKTLCSINKVFSSKVIQITPCEKEQLRLISTLFTLFDKQFYAHVVDRYNQSNNLKGFSEVFVGNNREDALYQINRLYFHKTQKSLNLTKYMNELQQFISCSPSQLKYLLNYNQILQADYLIYDKFYQKNNLINKYQVQLKPIRQILVHRQIASKSTTTFTLTSYNDLFGWIKNYYYLPKTSMQEKSYILNYTYDIYDRFILKNDISYKEKHSTFVQIINERHLQFGKLLDTLNDKEKDMICKIFKMKDKFQDIIELIDNFSIETTLATMTRLKREENM